MTNLKQVYNDRTFMKDPNSTALINIDVESIRIAKEAKRRRIEKEEELETLKSEVSDIKKLLLELNRKMGD